VISEDHAASHEGGSHRPGETISMENQREKNLDVGTKWGLKRHWDSEGWSNRARNFWDGFQGNMWLG